ncbi:spore gernimation protein KA [Oceanobacillus piezotolerans]|uniref:Spore gernimation protein KA n=1 Tax=Oceanobacillus piezotolerans TaxID=2448030 RepID=A0A498D8U1_9BACI|nr:spore germination protein GerPB [Oceanobacillus piezotolerans]RLL45041.1 spore gernimation protein KA [Oceanobacillus piezotolerans]
MHFTIHQSINIHLLKIGSITNSSVVQIGSTGSIQGQSEQYNTGGFTEEAKTAEVATEVEETPPLVPLSP